MYVFDSPFIEDSKNTFFFQGGPTFWEEMAGECSENGQ